MYPTFALRVRVIASTLFVFALVLSGTAAFAQQVTYYDFDSAPANSSYACSPSSAANPLFCLNDGTGSSANPSFLSDTYPAIIDPVTTDTPPISSTHTAVQMTSSVGGQAGSMWFSIPQKVSTGFTAYFAFKLVSTPNSFATADGIAFVIQNSAGGGSVTASDGTVCTAQGSGTTAVGVAGPGGCIGYGGIDNSLALEFDTYQNAWDPSNNHVALQNCGAGRPNSPDHSGSCLVQFGTNAANLPALASPSINFADGNVHQVVVEYSGPNEAIPNQLQIFIDPPFVSGTHTPLPGTVPVLSGTYDIGGNLNLINSGTANDSAFVGFTAATGGAFEQQEIMAWTFTPHTPSTQQQPLNPPGTPTTFPFGAHTFTVTYPSGGPSTNDIDMIVTANTITPAFFTQLSIGRPYAGSQCQVYDETGGNCIVYSSSCVTHGTTNVVACPAITDPASFIDLKSAYNNSIAPTKPGFLQGDPLYSLLTSITGDGTTATVSCVAECTVTVGQTITIGGTSVGNTPGSAFDGTYTVTGVNANPTGFTFASTATGMATGGYVASNNVQNIFTSYVPQRIDGTTAGKTKNFSDFVVTSTTIISPTQLLIAAPAVPYGTAGVITVTATSSNGAPTGLLSLVVDNNPALSAPLSNGVAIFNLPNLTGGVHQLAATYVSQGNFAASSATGTLTVTPVAPTVTFTGAPASAPFGATFPIAATSNSSALPTITAGGACTLAGNIVTIISSSGICSLGASWAADTNYTAASLTQFTTATKASSVTSILTDTPNPSVVGVPVTLSFKVSGVTVPTGTYTVASSVAGDPQCSGSLVAGAGACVLTFATPGGRNLTVTYAGDANYLGSFTTAAQSVSAGPLANVSTNALDFGAVYLGSVTVKSVTLTNKGSAPMTITQNFLQIVGGGNSKEFVAVSLCPSSLGVGKSCSILVTFIAGPTYTPQTATLMITDSAYGSPQLVSLTATVINPQGTFRPAEVEFGSIKVGTSAHLSTVLTNTGTTPLAITSIGLSGVNAGDFNLSTAGCLPSLNAGSSCTIGVTFTPSKTGSRTANIVVFDNAKGGSQQALLQGSSK